VATAKKHARIPYGDLARHVGVANQGLGPYLDRIYKDELANAAPDLTLVAVYSGTEYGRYNSRGRQPKTIKVNPNNPAHVRAYEAELNRVYSYPWR